MRSVGLPGASSTPSARILLDTGIAQSGFATKHDAYFLGPRKHCIAAAGVWSYLTTEKDGNLPEAPGRSASPASARPPPVRESRHTPLDICALKMAQLLEIVQKEDSHYCVMGLRVEDKLLGNAFVTATKCPLAASVADAKALHLETPVFTATEDDFASSTVERNLSATQMVYAHASSSKMASFTTAAQAPVDSSSLTTLSHAVVARRPPRSRLARSGRALIPEEFCNLPGEESKRTCDPDTEIESASFNSPTSSSRSMVKLLSRASTTELTDSDEETVGHEGECTPPTKSNRVPLSKLGRVVIDQFTPARVSGMPSLVWPEAVPRDRLVKTRPNSLVRSLFKA